DRTQQIVLLHTILKGNERGLTPHDRQQQARRLLGVPQLDPEHHQIDFADRCRIVGRFDLRQTERLVRALDRKPMLAHGRKVGAAGNEVHVGPAACQLGAEKAPDPARSHDRNPQRFPPGSSPAATLAYLTICNRTSRPSSRPWPSPWIILEPVTETPHIASYSDCGQA